MVNFSSLKTQAEMALAKLTEGKYFEIKDLNNRLQKVATALPHDTVINAVARVIEQLSKKEQTKIISQGEIEKIYNQLIGLNASGTKFREVLGDLLVSKGPQPMKQNSDYIRGMRDDPKSELLAYDIDSNVKEGFDQLFEKNADKYDQKSVLAAQTKIGMELKSLGYEARIRLMGGNSKFLVFSADFDTNRGIARVLIPLESSGEKFPEVFIANSKCNKLTKQAINSFLSEASHSSLQLPHNIKDIDMPKVNTPEPLKVLATQIEENVIESSVGYPLNTVRVAKKILASELDAMGFQNAQIRVAGPMTGGFICEAILNTPKGNVTIETPIEMNNDIPLLPAVFAKGDFVDNFDASSLHRFVSNGSVDSTVIRADSNFHGMNLPQLKDALVKSAMREDYDSCNEIMGVIETKFDEDTYRNVVADYHKVLLNVGNVNEKLAYNDKDQFVKTPNSMYPIHKKLGRPAHELVRDENGEYHLKSTYSSRQNQQDFSAFFSNAKALIGD